jgi:poly-gamma-glutamate synthesis protein (capsule biosynthesis protein)
MRAITHYEPLEEDQPGTPSQIMTWPLERDLEALEEDVRRSKEKADIVIVSLHWGVHWIPGLIADYQPEVARAAIDVGASAVVGHHPHLVKGVDFHKGKPILYSLGNFAHDTNSAYRPTDQAWRQELKKTYALYGTPGPHDYRQLSEARYSMILSLEISRKGIETVSFLPVVIDEASVPEVVSASSPIGKEIASYLDQVSHDAGFTPDFAVDGERVLARPGR